MRYSLSHCRYVQAVNPLRFHPMLSRIQCEKHHRDRQAKSPRPAASRIQADCISQTPHLIFMGMTADDKIHSRQILPDQFFVMDHINTESEEFYFQLFRQFRLSGFKFICPNFKSTCLSFKSACLSFKSTCLSFKSTCLSFKSACLSFKSTCPTGFKFFCADLHILRTFPSLCFTGIKFPDPARVHISADRICVSDISELSENFRLSNISCMQYSLAGF